VDAGFTLLETTVAMLVLMVGLLGLASALSFSLTVTNRGRNVTNSKLLISSVLEQMETLRNTKQLTFGQISNTGAVDNRGATQNFAGFPTASQPVTLNPGPDGIFGTGDDLLDAGNDGVYGTGDDFTNPALGVTGYQRQIEITNLSSTLKRIQVTLQSSGGGAGGVRTLIGVCYLNDNAHSNFTP
jgi:type II secretory pathway pseudopilin PulG